MSDTPGSKAGDAAQRPRRRFRPPLTITNPALLTDGSDLPFRELIQSLLVMAHLLEELRHRLARRAGVSEPQYRVFMAVAHQQGEDGVSVSAVARHLRITGAFVTREAGRLVRRGYIEKREDPDDRRGVRLSLTAEGEQVIRDFAPAAQVINDEVFRDISSREFDSLSEIIERIVRGGERAVMVDDRMRITEAHAERRGGRSGARRRRRGSGAESRPSD